MPQLSRHEQEVPAAPLFNMKTVFLFIPNYVYSSDLLHTHFIRTLAERVRVIIFLPMSADAYLKHPNITYISWALQFPSFWTFWGKTIRVPLIRMFDHEPLIQRNYQLSFGHWKRKVLRRIAFLFPKRFWNPNFITNLETRHIPFSPAFAKYVEDFHPSLIVTPTPGFTEMDAEAIVLARKSGIPSVAMDFSWDNLTSNCKHLRKTDYLITWTDGMRKQAIAIHGYDPDRVSVSGIMRFDHYFQDEAGETAREAFLTKKGLDPKEKTILVTTVTRGNYKDEPAIIRELLKARDAGIFPGRPNIFIRIHPKEDNYQEYKDFERFPNVRVERGGHEREKNLGSRIELDASDLANLKDTLRHSDVVVNYASTITLEAFVFDKPVVNIGFPAYYMNAYSFSHYKPVVEAGAMRIAHSMEELLNEVDSYLREPSRDRTERAQAVSEFIGFHDGKSYERAVDGIATIQNRASKQ